MIDNGCVNVLDADPFSPGMNNCAVRDDSHIGGPTSDINNRGSVWIIYSYTCAECGRQSFFNHYYPADTRMLGSAEQRPFLHLRDTRQDTHQCATAKIGVAAACFLDEMRQHLLSSLKVCDHPVEQWSDHRNITGLAAGHLLRFNPNRYHFSGIGVDGDEGWLIYHYAAPTHRNDGCRRSHIYGHRIGD